MFKKTALVASILLVSACSSYDDSKTDYVNDVVVQKTQQQDYVEIVGKDIIPVDLLELNLGLKVSLLSVTARVDSDTNNQAVNTSIESASTSISASPSTNAASNKTSLMSDVFFDIEYEYKKASQTSETKVEKEAKAAEENFEEYNTALVNEMKVALSSDGATQSCDENRCLVSQKLSFPVETSLLAASKIDGLKFSLLDTTENEKLILETMIPGRYITALLADDTTK